MGAMAVAVAVAVAVVIAVAVVVVVVMSAAVAMLTPICRARLPHVLPALPTPLCRVGRALGALCGACRPSHT